ncbi:hypothetical protein RCH18_001628 [Flavobacterium sp. PL11]|jgi:nitrous oxidase accessory protein|uniref:hypothetical protein n=1 Tax=Flavobacterium sp. PL11 TaxID=3071717 RepID=UPI002DFB2EB0|nr:hypothetical protein [Flavobacterium sp. PL11]
MKNSFTKIATIFTLVLANAFYAQNIITVDNNVNSSANFTSLQAAINSAQPNDFIYISPSETSYEGGTTSKKLHFRGIGHTPEVTAGISANIGAISLISSGTPAASAAGSSISGLQIASISMFQGTALQVNNVTIENNLINQISATNADNWVVRGNIITSRIITDINSNNWLIVNNFFNVLGASLDPLNGLSVDTTVSNNIFVTTGNQPSFTVFTNCFNVANNNIFISQNAATTGIGISNAILSNNLSFNAAGTTMAALLGTGNFNNVNPSFTTITPANNFTFSLANNYNVSNASLVGVDGTPIGIFGFNFPFNKRGYPFSMPYIESMNILNQTIPLNGTLQVDVTAKSN